MGEDHHHQVHNYQAMKFWGTVWISNTLKKNYGTIWELCLVHKRHIGVSVLNNSMVSPTANGSMSSIVKCYEMSNVINCQMSYVVKCHELSNVMKCQMSSNVKFLKTPEFGWRNMWTAPIFNVSMPPNSRCSCKLDTLVCTPEARLPHWQLAPPKVACLAPINPTVKKSPNQAFAGEKSKSTTLWRKKSPGVIASNTFR